MEPNYLQTSEPYHDEARRMNGTNGVSQRRSILRFNLDKPVAVTLETMPADAVEQQGNYAVEWRYFCAGNEMLYAPLALHNELLRVPAAAITQRLQITKVKQGREHAFRVALLPDTCPADPFARFAAKPEPPRLVPTGAKAPQPAIALIEQQEEPYDSAEWPTEPPPLSRSHTSVPAPQSLPPRPQSGTLADHLLLQAYAIAIECAAKACSYAKERHGMLLTPEFADVRAIAATIYIQASKGRE